MKVAVGLVCGSLLLLAGIDWASFGIAGFFTRHFCGAL